MGIKFRKLKVIIAHVGHPWVDQGICVVAKHPNFYADMAAWCKYGVEYLYDALLKFKNLNCIQRVVYGSENGCTRVFPKMYKKVNEVAQKRGTPEITDDEMASIMGETAAKLYKLNK